MRNKYIRENNRNRLTLRNLATSLILYEKIRTTVTRAKKVKPIVEKMIASGQRGNNANQKKLVKFFTDSNAVKKINEDLVKRFGDRKSGFIRTAHIGFRAGDAAPMIIMELNLPKKIGKETQELVDKKTTKVKVKTRIKTKIKEKSQIEPKKGWLDKVSGTGLGKKISSATKNIWTKRTTSK